MKKLKTKNWNNEACVRVLQPTDVSCHRNEDDDVAMKEKCSQPRTDVCEF